MVQHPSGGGWKYLLKLGKDREDDDDLQIFSPSPRIGSLPSLRSPSSLTNQDLYICFDPLLRWGFRNSVFWCLGWGDWSDIFGFWGLGISFPSITYMYIDSILTQCKNKRHTIFKNVFRTQFGLYFQRKILAFFPLFCFLQPSCFGSFSQGYLLDVSTTSVPFRYWAKMQLPILFDSGLVSNGNVVQHPLYLGRESLITNSMHVPPSWQRNLRCKIVGFQTPWGWRYTPKTYRKKHLEKEVLGRLGDRSFLNFVNISVIFLRHSLQTLFLKTCFWRSKAP